MRKKFLARRGFTIVEVMVAFVIFAIMAGMVATILSGTMQAKRENTALEAEIAKQQSTYYTKTLERDYDSSSSDSLTFNFTDASVTIPYSIGDANADDADNEIALEYFVGKVNYDVMNGKQTTQNNDGEKNDGGSVADYFQSTGIYGSNGINSISVVLQRDTDYTDGYRYMIATKALGDVDEQYDMFKQYRFVFPGTIKKFGRCYYNSSTRKFDFMTTPTGYTVSLTTSNTIRIAATQTDSSEPLTKVGTGFKAFYVVLNTELENISATLNPYEIFGYCDTDKSTKLVQSDGSYLFTQYEETVTDDEGNVVTDDDGNTVYKTYPNIFAAIEKVKTKTTDDADDTTE